MKKYSTVLALSMACLMACHSRDAEKPATPSIPLVPQQPTAQSDCYRGIFNRDTTLLSLEINGSVFKGNLNFNRFQKDNNTGSFEGKLSGDTLIGNYTFQSEGMTSTREVVFLKVNNMLVEGFGDVEEKEGVVHFKDRSKLNFNIAQSLAKINCKP